jgi:uncharacterized protein (TIGR00266 family)
MQYRIEGTTLPVVTVTLTPGQRIYSSSGGMSWMTQEVEMDTNTGGGLGKMFKRALSGESLFVVDYYVDRGQGEVAFSAEFPGKILDLDLAAGQSVIVQKDAFMCADKSVDLDMHFRKRLGAGLFGGEGFILQRLTGPGRAFVNFDGEILVKELQPGELLRVDTGHVAMIDPTVEFDVEIVRGFKNILLGGEGLFHFLVADGFLTGMEGIFEPFFELVAGAAGRGALFAGQVAQAAQEVGDGAVAAEEVAEPGFGGLDGFGGGEFFLCAVL